MNPNSLDAVIIHEVVFLKLEGNSRKMSIDSGINKHVCNCWELKIVIRGLVKQVLTSEKVTLHFEIFSLENFFIFGLQFK